MHNYLNITVVYSPNDGNSSAGCAEFNKFDLVRNSIEKKGKKTFEHNTKNIRLKIPTVTETS